MQVAAPAEIESGASAAQRPPLKSVTLLMPVWGYRFVSQFLEFCLPTLLAPGNMPAVAGMLPCRFVLLSSETDEPLIQSHPAWHELKQICEVEIQRIDDLITDGNHSATITLAFARAVRQSGDAMLDTCFIFLVSDYLVADGSLASVVKRIRAGASGVVAGNFQVIAEDAIPALRRQIAPGSSTISLPPRKLMSWSLAHLHPATVANMVNFGLSHNTHTNRLFWRVDESTLIGRFYLMHMIGIRPELTDFVVGASCDYSFIPEMCPSGNVAAITDSDEYLVVEMQPRSHEAKWLLPGPVNVQQLADSLSEWTTAQHRGNVANTIVYHAAELPPNLAKVSAEADALVDKVRGALTAEPHPHRNHHYWIGSIAWHRVMTRRPLSREDWRFLLGETMPKAGLPSFLWRLRVRFLGAPPGVTRLHPRWPDYGLPIAALRKIIAQNGRTLLVAPRPAAFAQWLTRNAGDIYTLESARLLEITRSLYLPLVGRFDACLIVLSEDLLAKADEFITRAGPLLKPGGQILVMATNDRGRELAADFSQEFARQSARLLDLSAWVSEIHYVPASRLRWAIFRATLRLVRRGDMSGWASLTQVLLLAVPAIPLMLATFILNLGIRATPIPPRGLWSSVFLILRPSSDGIPPSLPDFESNAEAALRSSSPMPQPDHGGLRAISGDSSAPAARTSAISNLSRDSVGLARTLARYRFVANLLDRRHDVAEYGRVDSLGIGIVMQTVKKIAVYSPDPAVIAHLQRNVPADWPLKAHVHDILSGPLPKPHDSIYSLDFFQNVPHGDQEKYVRNLRDSLSRDHDILIVGCPSYSAGEPAPPARPASRAPAEHFASDRNAGAVGPKPPVRLPTPVEIKALMEGFFHVVFLFSMVDEVVHPGILRAADYAFAVCCDKKDPSRGHAPHA